MFAQNSLAGARGLASNVAGLQSGGSTQVANLMSQFGANQAQLAGQAGTARANVATSTGALGANLIAQGADAVAGGIRTDEKIKAELEASQSSDFFGFLGTAAGFLI